MFALLLFLLLVHVNFFLPSLSGSRWLEQSNPSTSGETSCRLSKLGSFPSWSPLETLWVWLCGILFNHSMVCCTHNLDSNHTVCKLPGLPRSNHAEWNWKYQSLLPRFQTQGFICIFTAVLVWHFYMVIDRVRLTSLLVSLDQSCPCWWPILDHHSFFSSWAASQGMQCFECPVHVDNCYVTVSLRW